MSKKKRKEVEEESEGSASPQPKIADSVGASEGCSALLHESSEDPLKTQLMEPLEEKWPEGLAKVEEEEWQEVLFTVDSGAMNTVVGMDECPQFHLNESP